MRVNEIEMYYELRGEGYPLVLIMGLAGNAGWWSPELVDKLAGHYRVLMFDNRGSGRTDAPVSGYSIPAFAGDTAGLMTSLGIERAHVFGVSMGGMIAQEFALSHPDRVNRLVLGCTNCGTGRSVAASEEVIKLMVSQFGIHSREVLEIMFPRDYLERNRDKEAEFIRIYSENPISPAAFMLQLGAIMGFDSHDRLDRITAPTLVITGDRDVLIPPENSEILAGGIPGARLETLKGCGHGFVSQAPEEVYCILREFLV